MFTSCTTNNNDFSNAPLENTLSVEKRISDASPNFIPTVNSWVEKMKIKVHYISLVKSFTKTSQDEFDLKDDTLLADLLDKIAATTSCATTPG